MRNTLESILTCRIRLGFPSVTGFLTILLHHVRLGTPAEDGAAALGVNRRSVPRRGHQVVSLAASRVQPLDPAATRYDRRVRETAGKNLPAQVLFWFSSSRSAHRFRRRPDNNRQVREEEGYCPQHKRAGMHALYSHFSWGKTRTAVGNWAAARTAGRRA